MQTIIINWGNEASSLVKTNNNNASFVGYKKKQVPTLKVLCAFSHQS